jgi:hypothetical protein
VGRSKTQKLGRSESLAKVLEKDYHEHQYQAKHGGLFMPKLDLIHDAVKNALIKDGWTITADPYTIQYEEVKLFADLAADRPIAAERAGQKIVVEVKSFINLSPVHDFQAALGQYEMYRSYLELTAPERKLYLAVNSTVYSNFFELKAIQLLVQRHQLSILTVEVEKEEVEQWIN